jgi:hypothetical protein
MTLDEAHLILNLKKESPLEEVMKVCSLVFYLAYPGSLIVLDASTTSISSKPTHLQHLRQRERKPSPSPSAAHGNAYSPLTLTISSPKWFVRSSE